MKIIIRSIDELPALAAKVRNDYSSKIIAFYGAMGVGKTTFIKSLCIELGVDASEICSPTYGLVNEYEAENHQRVYHFDFYRLKDENEAFDMGYENYFYSNHYCFIEWPEKIANLLPEKLLKIHIKSDHYSRIFTMEEF